MFFEGNSGAFREHPRTYFRCGTCDLIFTSVSQLLSPQDEKAEYDRHQNNPDDWGYRHFLGRLCDPLQNRIEDHSRGLDFGSGPGPTLSVMLEEAGHSVALYDPFYAPDTAVLKQTYDFVTATEVVEHLHHPRRDLEQIWRCLKPGGWLGIMTKLAHSGDEHGDETSAPKISDPHRDAFATWHYKDDLTHVCFFSRKTFLWLGQLWRCQLTFIGSDVILLQKPG
jgi:SAM-dependent methyltransferase